MNKLAMTVLAGLTGATVLLASVLLVRAAWVESVQPAVDTPQDLPAVNDDAIHRLAGAVRIPTVSPAQYTDEQLAPFEELFDFLETAFPRVHAELTREKVGPCSLMYTWEGDAHDTKPAVLMSHLDVVPVEDGEERDWTKPPFSLSLIHI